MRITVVRGVVVGLALCLGLAAAVFGCGKRSEPGRQFAYVANASDGSVSMLQVERSTGALKYLGVMQTGKLPSSAAVDRSGRFLFVPNEKSNDVTVFSINQKTGLLSQMQTVALASAWGPSAVLMHPADRFVYILNGKSSNLSAFELGTASAFQAELVGSPFNLAGLRGAYKAALDARGHFGYVTSLTEDRVAAFTIDQSSGAWAPVPGSPYRTGQHPNAIAVHPSGLYAYVVARDGLWAYAVDRETGALSKVEGSPFPGTGLGTMVNDALGKYLLSVGSMNAVLVYQVDVISGVLKPLGGVSTISKPIFSLAMEPSGRYVYATNLESDQVFAFRLDDKGELKPVPGSPFAVIKGARPAAARPVSGEASYNGDTHGTWIAVTPRYK